MKKKDKRDEKIPFSERICQKLDAMPLSPLSIEITGRQEAVIWGCKSILVYSEELIRLGTSGPDVLIEGKKLTCPAYGGGGIVISGLLRSISYEEN